MFIPNTTPSNDTERSANFEHFMVNVMPKILQNGWSTILHNERVWIIGKDNARIGVSNIHNTWTEYTLSNGTL